MRREGVNSIAPPKRAQVAKEKLRLAQALKELGLIDKAKEVEMCGQWVSRQKSQHVKTRTCGDCGATFVVQSRCHARFCPECAAIEARDNLRGKEAMFEEARCAIARLPLPHLANNNRAAFTQAKKEAVAKVRKLLGRECVPTYHKILAGCCTGEFRWELVVLASEGDVENIETGWPYGVARVLKRLTPAQALALYLGVVARLPEWEIPKDLATLDNMLFRQRLKGSHGQAHGNSRAMKIKPRSPKPPQHCPICGSSNLGRPSYRDADGIRWVNSIPLWFPPSPGLSPPRPDYDFTHLGQLP